MMPKIFCRNEKIQFRLVNLSKSTLSLKMLHYNRRKNAHIKILHHLEGQVLIGKKSLVGTVATLGNVIYDQLKEPLVELLP